MFSALFLQKTAKVAAPCQLAIQQSGGGNPFKIRQNQAENRCK
jgi:hypothetical protein